MQVVNYNIFPAPELEFSQASDNPITVSAYLVYGDDRGENLHGKIYESSEKKQVLAL